MDLRQRIIDALGDEALTIDDVAASVGEPAEPLERLIRLSPSFATVGERVAYLPALLDGTTWIVPVDADDAASDLASGGFIRMHPHLGMIGWWLIDSAVSAYDADGTELGTITTDGVMLDGGDTDIITCAPGWLDAVAGGWAAVTIHDESLTIAPVDGPPEATAAQAAAITSGFEMALAASRATPGLDGAGFDAAEREFELSFTDDVVNAALLTDRDAFRNHPAPPVEQLIAAAGLEHRNGIIAAPGFDWDAYRAWQRRNGLRIRFGLDDEQSDIVQALVGACELHADQGDAFGEPAGPAAGAFLADALDDAAIASAFTGEATSRGVQLQELLGFAEALDRHARSVGSDRNEGVTAVIVRAHTLLGEEALAVELLDATVDTSTRHPHLLHLAAEVAADRGRAAEARQLILRTGVTRYDPEADRGRGPWEGGPTDAQLLLGEVEGHVRPRARRDVGRNEPCPCGSGKKYKACHLGKEEAPLADRAPWLYDKCMRYVRSRVPASLDDVAEQIVGDEDHLYYDVADSPIVADIVLHEHQVDQDFLRARGPLLPDDEQLLAAQWTLVDRGVFEVEDVRTRPGGGELRLRNQATGDIVVVTQIHLGDQVRPGLILLGRPLPVGDTYRALGGFWPLERSEVNAVVDAIAADDTDTLCQIMGARLRPPTLTNTDGHLMEWHRITWSVPAEPDAVGAVLATAGLHGPEAGAEPEVTRWTLVRDSANQRNTVIAAIDVAPADGGSEVVIELNSEERAEELDGLMEEWFPEAEVVHDEIIDFDQLASPGEAGPPGESPALDDPGVREALERHIAEYEAQWLDDHIPALGGRTPRDAVQDPIGREEVLHLLARFPEPEPGTPGMSPARLRRALGL